MDTETQELCTIYTEVCKKIPHLFLGVYPVHLVQLAQLALQETQSVHCVSNRLFYEELISVAMYNHMEITCFHWLLGTLDVKE